MHQRHLTNANRLARSALMLLLVVATASSARAGTLTFDAQQLYKDGLAQDVQLSEQSAALVLERGALYEDDGPAAGYTYESSVEKLSDQVRIRKTLIVPNPNADRAELLVAPGGDALKCTINGESVTLNKPRMSGNYWQVYRIDPAALKAGENRIVLWGEGQVWIARDGNYAAGSRTRTHHPNRSAKSTDGGKTWRDERLGTDNNRDGEYYVRLFLDHHPPQGDVRTPVIDLANLDGDTIAPSSVPLDNVRITADTSSPQNTEARLQVRTGPTPDTDNHWSKWQAVGENGSVNDPAGRYAQVRVELATDHAVRTPVLRGITVRASEQSTPDWVQRVHVNEQDNNRIVRSSVPFEYEPFDHPQLQQLRARYNLDDLVNGAETELELIEKLALWSANAWESGHLGESYPPWNALEILKKHADGTPIGGFCLQYNTVFLQACESFGLVGRAVSLGPGPRPDASRSGHEVVEIWSNQFDKWIYVDGNFAYYAVDAQTDVPLSLMELRERQLAMLDGQSDPSIRFVHLRDSGDRWEGLNVFPPFVEMRLIPRSNFLEQASPLPLRQGMRGWFWTGHHVWSDDKAEARHIYGNRIHRPADWQWSLNRTRFFIEAADEPGTLRVHLITQTPGFDTFVARIDDNEARAVSSTFTWQLHEGENRLTLQSRNIAGRKGAPSSIVLEYQP